MQTMVLPKIINTLTISIIIAFPSALFAQKGNPTRQQRALMHHEVPDQAFTPNTSENRKTSPAYHKESSLFFMTQVNVNENGENILWDAANEPSLAIDPTNPNRMFIGWRQFSDVMSNFRQAGYGYTLDGGNTWTFPGMIDAGVFRSDPVLDADINGNIYYNSLTVDADENYVCNVYRIQDGGTEWGEGIPAQGGDKQWMRIDQTNGQGSGHNYSFWTSYWSSCYPGAFTRSTDWGNSYEDCYEVSGDPSWGTLAIGPEGELYLAGAGYPNDIVVTKSTTASNAGNNVSWDFSSPVDLDGYVTAQVDVNPAGLLGQVWIDTDKSEGPGRGNVYVVASVVRYSNNDPGDVMFSKSVDGGLTWTDAYRINKDLGADQTQWFGTMSVSPDGRIDVVWLDTRESTGANPYLSALYYSYSYDQGESWSDNERLCDNFDPHIGWPQQQKMGDYFDMISDVDHAHLAWSNTLNGEQDVYYGRITPQVLGMNESEEFRFTRSLSVNPNPVLKSATIKYELSANETVKIMIIDQFGNRVQILCDENQDAGKHQQKANFSGLASGVYLCTIQAGQYTKSVRLTVIH